jgi:hypothetical protein
MGYAALMSYTLQAALLEMFEGRAPTGRVLLRPLADAENLASLRQLRCSSCGPFNDGL